VINAPGFFDALRRCGSCINEDLTDTCLKMKPRSWVPLSVVESPFQAACGKA